MRVRKIRLAGQAPSGRSWIDWVFPRRWERRLVRGYLTVLYALALSSLVSLAALLCADALGSMGGVVVLPIALVSAAAVLFAAAGVSVHVVALLFGIVVLVGSTWFGIDVLAVIEGVHPGRA